MSIGDKIADSMPDGWVEYVHDHPRVVYLVTIPLVAYCAWTLAKAYRLHAYAELFVAARKSDAARAASEALGG